MTHLARVQMDGDYLSWRMKHTGFEVPYIVREVLPEFHEFA